MRASRSIGAVAGFCPGVAWRAGRFFLDVDLRGTQFGNDDVTLRRFPGFMLGLQVQ